MTIDKTVFIPVDLDTAFALITQPERLRRWQTVAARVDLRVGGEYRWTFTPGHSAAGTFTEIEPGKRVVFTWDWEGPTSPAADAFTVTITLDSVDGGRSPEDVCAFLADEGQVHPGPSAQRPHEARGPGDRPHHGSRSGPAGKAKTVLEAG